MQAVGIGRRSLDASLYQRVSNVARRLPMRRILQICGIVALTCACAGSGGEEATPQGGGDTAITPEEQAQLQALRPEVAAITEEVLGGEEAISPGKPVDLDRVETYKTRVADLYRTRFGDHYRKFITDMDVPVSSAQVTPESAAAPGRTAAYGDSASYTQRGLFGGISARHWKTYPSGTWPIDETHQYFLNVNVHTYSNGIFTFYYVYQWMTDELTVYYWYDDHHTFGSSSLTVEDQLLSAQNGWSVGPVEAYGKSSLALFVPSPSLISTSTIRDSYLANTNPWSDSFWW
jgi:hypothetical protein